MNTLSISKKELSELKELSMGLFHQLIRICKELVSWFWNRFLVWFNQMMEDYSIDNIQKEGLVGIWIRRASVFFGLDEEKVKSQIKKITKPSKKVVRKTLLWPLYLLITLLYVAKKRLDSASNLQKVHKKVNSYNE
jgi:hypothetical protein